MTSQTNYIASSKHLFGRPLWEARELDQHMVLISRLVNAEEFAHLTSATRSRTTASRSIIH
jgi:hypothetical protein